MHQNRFLFCTAVQLATVYIRGFIFVIHLVFRKTMFVRAVAAYAGTAQKYYWKKIDCNTCDFEVDYQTRVTYHKELFSSTFMLYIVYLKKRNHKKNIWMIVWCKEIKCDTCGFDVDFQRSIEWHKNFFLQHILYLIVSHNSMICI